MFMVYFRHFLTPTKKEKEEERVKIDKFSQRGQITVELEQN